MNNDERLARVYLSTVTTLDEDTLRGLVARNGVVRTAELVATAGRRPVDWERQACRTLDRARRRRAGLVACVSLRLRFGGAA
jgi:hypothetical protein